jgi:hypothetical protein
MFNSETTAREYGMRHISIYTIATRFVNVTSLLGSDGDSSMLSSLIILSAAVIHGEDCVERKSEHEVHIP